MTSVRPVRQSLAVAGVLLVAALIVGIPLWRALLDTTPQSLRDDRNGASVELHAEDRSFVFSSDCVWVDWALEGIQVVELNGVGKVGVDRQLSCDDALEFEVVFQNGDRETYALEKEALADTLPGRALLVVVALLVLAAVVVSGVPARLWRTLARSRVGAAWQRWFPREATTRVGRDRRRDFWLLVALVLVGMVVRAAFLSIPAKHDETWTYIEFASKPLLVGLSTYDSTNNHLFYTLMMHVSTRLFGLYPWVIRLPAFFAGILMIPMAYQAARRLYRGSAAPLLTAALVVGSSQLIEFSVNGRGYTTMILVFLLLFVLAADLFRHATRRRWVAFALASAVGLYTLPTMLYPLGLVCGWLLLSAVMQKRGQALRSFLHGFVVTLCAAAVMTVLLYAPIFITGSWAEGQTTSILSTLQTGAFLKRVDEIARLTWQLWNRDLPPGFSEALMIGFVVAVVWHNRAARQSLPWFVSALLWLPAVTFIQQVSTYARLWLYLLPMVLMTAAVGLTYGLFLLMRRWPVARHWVVSVACLLAVALMGASVLESDSIYLASETGLQNEAAPMVQHFQQIAQPGDHFICAGACYPILFYAEMAGFDIGGVYDPIPAQTRRLFVIFATHVIGERDWGPVLAALPPEYQTSARDEMTEYAAVADIYIFEAPGDTADDR